MQIQVNMYFTFSYTKLYLSYIKYFEKYLILTIFSFMSQCLPQWPYELFYLFCLISLLYTHTFNLQLITGLSGWFLSITDKLYHGCSSKCKVFCFTAFINCKFVLLATQISIVQAFWSCLPESGIQ